jgi:hypothetical protein
MCVRVVMGNKNISKFENICVAFLVCLYASGTLSRQDSQSRMTDGQTGRGTRTMIMIHNLHVDDGDVIDWVWMMISWRPFDNLSSSANNAQ